MSPIRVVWLGVHCLCLAACTSSPGTRPDASVPQLASDGGLPDADGGGVPDPDGGADAGPPRHALFIGNSYTQQNDLPGLVRALGEATPGGALQVEMIAQGGATLGTHWQTPGTPDRVAQGGFDFVVLQGQSLEAVHGDSSFDLYAEIFADAVHEAGAEGVWFATWARREGDAVYSWLGDPAYMTYAIEESYRLAAQRHDDAIALVGAAFQLARAELPAVVLYAADGSHPSAAGSLLAACTIFHAMTGLPPSVPAPAPLGIPRDTAHALCALAARVGPSPRACPPGRTLCGEECVYLSWNIDHCGACNQACPAPEPCRSGVCGCEAPRTACERNCWDLETTPAHCGACGVQCGPGEYCAGGTCRCPSAGVVEMPLDALGAMNPSCDWSAVQFDGTSLACREAAHQLCAEYGTCFRSGLPPTTGHIPDFFDSGICVADDVRVTTYATLQTFASSCDGVVDRSGAACLTAVSRYCASLGAVSGWGPIRQSGGEVTVLCLPGAVRVQTTLSALGEFASRCPPDPVLCQSASRAFCEANGYVGGFGPVEMEGGDVEVVCLPR